MKLLTGLSCPACGIQRFVHALLHGHLQEAVGYNYYLVYALPYTLLLIAVHVLPHSNAVAHVRGWLESKPAVWLYIISFCVWFVVRNMFSI